MNKNENIYTSHCLQNLEDVYCNNRSAVTSAGLSCGSATLPTRIINGGKKVIYTATMAAMLLNNIMPAYADLTVEANQISSGLTVGTDTSNVVISRLDNYGTIIDTIINNGGSAYVYAGGVASGTTIYDGGK